MEKKILLSNGEILSLGFEDVLVKFDKMVKDFSHKQYKIYANKPSCLHMNREDFEQEVLVALWKAFENYNLESGACFSTFFNSTVKQHFSNFNRMANAEKLEVGAGTVSLQDADLSESGDELADVVGTNDERFADIEYIDSLETMLNTMDEQEKTIFLNEVSQNKTYEQLAEELGMSRQAIHYRLTKVYRPKWSKLFGQAFGKVD